MKSNLLSLKSCSADSSDFMEFLIASKFEDREFVDVLHLMTDVLERDVAYDDADFCDASDEEFFCERLKNDPTMDTSPEDHSNSLLYAGYVDCMDEAIRFLVEEENISEEHPVVKNLKAHLEKSKEKILQTFATDEIQVPEPSDEPGKTYISDDNFENNFPLQSVFLETFQKCRGSS